MFDFKNIKFGINRSRVVLSLHFSEKMIRATALSADEGNPITLIQDKVAIRNSAINDGAISDPKEIERKIKDLLLRINMVMPIDDADVVAVLPLQSLYMHYFEVESGEDDGMLESAISGEIKRNFPVDEDKLAISWQVYGRQEGRADGVIFGIETENMKIWADTVKSAAPNLKIFDLEPLTIGCYARNVGGKKDECFILARERDFQFVFLKNGMAVYSRTIEREKRFSADELKEKLKNDLQYIEERFSFKVQKVNLIDYGKEKRQSGMMIPFQGRNVALEKASDVPGFYGFDRTSLLQGNIASRFKREIRIEPEYIYSYCAAMRYAKGEIGREEPHFSLIGSIKPDEHESYEDAAKESGREAIKRWKKLFENPLAIILAALIIGLIFYGASSVFMRPAELSGSLSQSKKTSFVLEEKVSIAVDGYSYPDNIAKARIFKIQHKEKIDREKLIKNGMDRASLSMEKGETIWPMPIGLQEGDLKFPIETVWLLYKQEELERAVSFIASKKIANQSKRIIGLELKKIEPGSAPSVFLAEVNIEFEIEGTPIIDELAQGGQDNNIATTTAVKEIPVQPVVQKEKEPELAKIKKVDSSINIRSGPGLNYKVVGKAQPEKKYAIIGRTGEWINVKLDSDTSGWISKQFVE